MLTQYAEQRVVFQPPLIVRAEYVVTLARCAFCTEEKVAGGFTQQRKFEFPDLFKIHAGLAIRKVSETRVIEVTALGQALKADHQHISGEGRGAGIRRVAVADRTERKDLPQGLLGGSKPVHELMGCGAKIATPAAGGQGRGMHQDAR